MDDRKIEVLLTTIKEGSFSKAAESLHCTQSAVTQTMNSLEAELGFAVLNRSHNGVTLTPSGEEIYVSIVETYESMIRLKQNASRISSGRDMPIRIGAFSSITNSFLGRVIYEFRKKHPDKGINLDIGTRELKTWLKNGEVDIIIADIDVSKTFNWKKLFDDPYCAIVPSSYDIASHDTVTTEELINYPVINASFNDYNPILSKASHMIDIACDDDRTVLSFVSDEIGASILPSLSLWDIPDNVSVVALEPRICRTIGYALPTTPRREAVEFANYLDEKIREYHLV